MAKTGSDSCKEFLAAWIKDHKPELKLSKNRGPHSPDGTKPSHWLRRGKGEVDGQQVRAFELYIGQWKLPAEYAVVRMAPDGSVERLEWMGREDVCRMGLRIDSGVGGKYYWDESKGQLEVT